MSTLTDFLNGGGSLAPDIQQNAQDILSTQGAITPNLFINTWHSSPLVINQRSFGGDWSTLADGEHGLDMWLRTSSTHKGTIIEAGRYVPNAPYTIMADGVVLGTILSPSDGGHWLHSFPYASDKFSIRLGSNVPVPWHPDSTSTLEECYRYYLNYSGLLAVVTSPAANANNNFFPRKMRRTPDVTFAVAAGTGATLSATDTFVFQLGVHSIDANVTTLLLDATIALSDVTNDAEHRVVWLP